MLDQIHQQFIGVVRQGRGASAWKENPDMFSGLFWTGEQAVQFRPADQLGSPGHGGARWSRPRSWWTTRNKQNFAERFANGWAHSVGRGALAALQRRRAGAELNTRGRWARRRPADGRRSAATFRLRSDRLRRLSPVAAARAWRLDHVLEGALRGGGDHVRRSNPGGRMLAASRKRRRPCSRPPGSVVA